LKQPRYQALFNTTLSPDARAGDLFSLTNGSEYMSSGWHGITGNRFDGAIVDDPVAGRQQAESSADRDFVWNAYTDDLAYRLVPGGWLVIIMTRWHEEDLAGHILPEDWQGDSGMFDCRDGRQWEVLCLQAKCETSTDPLGRQIGEYLWPEWFDPSHWIPFEKIPRSWNSQCQGRPRAVEGAFFHEEDLLVNGKPIELPKKVDYVFAIIDSAMKTGKAHDGLAVTFYARSRLNTANPPLAVCDWDYTQIQGASLKQWLPSVFIRLEVLARETQAFGGSKGAFIEDKVSGTILLQQAQQQPDWHADWRSTPIDSKLTSFGKKEKALNASGHVAAGEVKFTRQAWERVVTFKGSTKNHLRSQVLNVSMESKDTDADDCLDTFSYGVAISLGNSKGF
jgi:hypothetical protein